MEVPKMVLLRLEFPFFKLPEKQAAQDPKYEVSGMSDFSYSLFAMISASSFWMYSL
jgi:hypothetical protein